MSSSVPLIKNIPNSMYSVQYAVPENNVLTEYQFDKNLQNEVVDSE